MIQTLFGLSQGKELPALPKFVNLTKERRKRPENFQREDTNDTEKNTAERSKQYKSEKPWYKHWLVRLILIIGSLALTIRALTWFFNELAKLVKSANRVGEAFANS